MKFFVLAGTEDGRELAEALEQRGHHVLVSTLTAYGANLIHEKGLDARYGALDAEKLKMLLENGVYDALLDATHPYAVQVKEIAQAVCQDTGIPYLRWQRSPLALDVHPLIHWAQDISTAAQIADQLGQRILLTTGSNALAEWLALSNLKDKQLFVRVLPTVDVLKRCETLGLKPNQIIAVQGPFSQLWNEAMIKQLNIDVVIAKESGKVGGTLEKVKACFNLNIPLVILKRPEDEGQSLSISQFIMRMEERLCNPKSFS